VGRSEGGIDNRDRDLCGTAVLRADGINGEDP
jgi:hypothetical protein